MRERRKEQRRKRGDPGRLFRFAHGAGDPFAFSGKGFLIVRLNCAVETGDSIFQLLAIIRRSVFWRTAVSKFGDVFRGITKAYLTGHLYCSPWFGFVKKIIFTS